jgi:hypothetical protein
VQYDSLFALQDSLNARLRRREQEADSAAIGANGAKGMTASQFAMAEERAQMFLAALASENQARMCGFSDAELAALKARRPELDELL